MSYKNEDVYVKGKGKYFHLVQPDTMYNKWSLLLYPDAPSLERIRELQAEGIKNKLKKDDEGYNISFSRPVSRENKKTGQTMFFKGPIVLDKEGKPYSEDLKIGWGSDVTVKLEVYEHAVPGSKTGAKAARLASVRIDNLIPYKTEDFTPEEQAQIAGLKEQPEPLF